MSLEPGTRIGPYEVVASLGAGGMGEVYRARDPRLDREVALKVLPAAFAQDAERLARFEREAKLLATLNHPNIAGVHGFEEADGRRILIMELVPGEDLSQRLARGALPLDEALAAALAIAEALEAAHGKGIVHRDLKPANVKVSADGLVKVLDFGLAKAVTGEKGGSSPELSQSPTLASPTQAGVILGTAAYMSPEQARGKPVDKRADIWAFGVLLFEMLTGRRLFEGETVSDTLAAVLKTEPDFTALPSETPLAVRRLLRRCLHRDPKERLHDMGDARLELKEARTHPETPVPVPSLPARRPARLTLILAAVALLSVAALAGALSARAPVAPPAPSFTLRRLTELPGAEEHPALSPDGRQIAYASAASGNKDIYLLRVGGDRAINLTAGSVSEDEHPAISADGETIAFRSTRDGGGLYLMGLTGESVRRVTSDGYEPAWSPDGRFLAYSTEGVRDVYAREVVAELWTVELSTGRTTRLLKGDAVQPRFSPDGQRIAYWANVRGQRDLFTVPAAGGEPVAVLQDAATDWSPEWSPDGQWLYFSSDRGGGMDLWRVRVDAGSGRSAGVPERVTTGVRSLTGARFSRDGRRLALMAYDRTADVSLYDLDPNAASLKLRTTLQPRSTHWCAPSQDASWLACAATGSPEDVVLLRADGGELRRLTNDLAKDRTATWSPDGRTIAFTSTRSGKWDYWSIQMDGSGLRQFTNIREMNFGLWLPSGREMVVTARRKDLYRVDLSRLSDEQTAQKLTAPATAGVFEPLAWSATDRVAGVEKDDEGSYTTRAYGVWDIKTGVYKRLRATVAGRPFGSMSDWLPDGRRLVVRGREGCLLVDAEADKTSLLTPCGPVDNVRTSGDGRTLLIEREVLDSDVWMLELP